MFNFNFYTPTRVVFGKETEYRIGKLVKNVNCKKVLLHYGSGSVIRSGLLGRIKESLDASGVTYVELGGVVPNPRLSLVRKGIELCRIFFSLSAAAVSSTPRKPSVTVSRTTVMSGISMSTPVRHPHAFRSALF